MMSHTGLFMTYETTVLPHSTQVSSRNPNPSQYLARIDPDKAPDQVNFIAIPAALSRPALLRIEQLLRERFANPAQSAEVAESGHPPP
jgi:hypothetical protein